MALYLFNFMDTNWEQKTKKTVTYKELTVFCYAEGRGRTGTPVKEPDFESGASAYSATSATDFSQIKYLNWGSWIRTNA